MYYINKITKKSSKLSKILMAVAMGFATNFGDCMARDIVIPFVKKIIKKFKSEDIEENEEDDN